MANDICCCEGEITKRNCHPHIGEPFNSTCKKMRLLQELSYIEEEQKGGEDTQYLIEE